VYRTNKFWLWSFSSRIARRQTPTQTVSNRSLMQVQRVPQLKIASHSDKKQCRGNAFGTLMQSADKHRQLLPYSTTHKYKRFLQFGVIRNTLRINTWTEFRHTAARHQGLLWRRWSIVPNTTHPTSHTREPRILFTWRCPCVVRDL